MRFILCGQMLPPGEILSAIWPILSCFFFSLTQSMGSNLGHVNVKETTALIIFLMDLLALNRRDVSRVLIRSVLRLIADDEDVSH